MLKMIENVVQSETGNGSNANYFEEDIKPVKIVVIGAGGAGNNTINRLRELGISTAQLVAVNTDLQQLKLSKADYKILIGRNTTRGRGAGGRPHIAYYAAQEDLMNSLEPIVKDAEMVFITAGMGGGTGTGSAGIIAKTVREIARKHGIVEDPLIVGVVTLPFRTEGTIKMEKAKLGLALLKKYADTVVVIDNQKLLEIVPGAPLPVAFKVADEIIANMIKGISDTVNESSLVNIDFNDVRTVMKSGSLAIMGLGEVSTKEEVKKKESALALASGGAKKSALVQAVTNALNNKLLDIEFKGGSAALVHFTVGQNIPLEEFDAAMREVMSRMDEDFEIIFGARILEEYSNTVSVMVIMNGVRMPLLDEVSNIDLNRVNRNIRTFARIVLEEINSKNPFEKPRDPYYEYDEYYEDIEIDEERKRRKLEILNSITTI